MSAGKPLAATRLAKYVSRRVLELRPRTQAQIATEAGFVNVNMLSMIKSGTTRLPIDRVAPLAKALGTDPVYMLLLTLEQMMGSTEAHAIMSIMSTSIVTENELGWVTALREASDVSDPPLEEQNIEKESQSLQKFYDSVRFRAAGVDNAEGKQRIVVELYDKFFRNAFPRMTEKLGIVYTPVEVVDFIIHSVNDVLQSEFGTTIGSKGVHILDPFTGTGTFITRLLQSGLIKPEELKHKFRHEIHANEIVLLAYYIAAINIEAVFHDLSEQDDYVPFEGICLTDTFQMYEKDDLVAQLMPDNSDRRKRQKELDIRVIVGNPPYSIGQGNQNDNNQNISYRYLDRRIEETYSDRSNATLSRGLYDSYIRAIRWASDRVETAGVIAFVTNAGFVDSASADGVRSCLADEFSDIYIFHLRGNQRTSGETSRREGGKIFGSGSRAPIAISILVKNPKSKKRGNIFFHDIGDYLSQKDKFERINSFKSIDGISNVEGWIKIAPDSHNDWIKQRDSKFDDFITMGDRKNPNGAIFEVFSLGVSTNRDAWVFNSSISAVSDNVRRMIEFFNHERTRFRENFISSDRGDMESKVDGFVESDKSRISWSVNLKQYLVRNREIVFEQECLTTSLYRPFQKQELYFNRDLNERVLQMPRIFPNRSADNLAIVVKGNWRGEGQFSMLTDSLPCSQPDGGAQCFPLKLFRYTEEENFGDLLADPGGKGSLEVRDGLTDAGLRHFQSSYPGEKLTKEDVFYYVYGVLHSEEYLALYADNLAKEIPRIPCMKRSEDFWAFSRAGRDLGHLHVGYETVEPFKVTIKQGDLRLAKISDPEKFYRVEKMKFGGKRPNLDKSTVIYNANITMTGIPLEAYDYVVNGKPALEWVMERQVVKTDKDSGIVNDANRYAIETVGNPAYPLELFQRVITVSLETMKIVRSLPTLDID